MDREVVSGEGICQLRLKEEIETASGERIVKNSKPNIPRYENCVQGDDKGECDWSTGSSGRVKYLRAGCGHNDARAL